MAEKNNLEAKKLSDDISQLRDVIFSNDGTGKVWQEGWYIFQDGKIQGPLGLMEALTRPYVGNDKQAVLISRRGYVQWYELSFLAPKIAPKSKQMLREAKIDSELSNDVQRTRSSPGSIAKNHIPSANIFESDHSIEPISGISQRSSEKSRTEKEEVLSKQALSEKRRKIKSAGKHPSFAPSLVTPTFPGQKEGAKKKQIHNSDYHTPISRTAADIAYQDYKLAVMPSAHVKTDVYTEAKPDRTRRKRTQDLGPTKGEVIQEYFISRGKLRLGAIRSSLIFAGVGFIFSFGLIWGYWLVLSLREIQFHCDNRVKTPWVFSIFSVIPGLHLLCVYFLASEVLRMQNQNRYSTVSKKIAVLLSLFPPAGIVYIQKAINDHWMLHAKSAIVKQSMS